MWELPPSVPPDCSELGLSPPSESKLLQRRKSLLHSQSLQLNNYNGDKVINIQVMKNWFV